MAVTKVGRHSPTPSMEAAEQRAFARSERRRGVREARVRAEGLLGGGRRRGGGDRRVRSQL